MGTYKKSAKFAGVLLIIGTLTGILSAILMSPILDDSEYLSKIAANENKVLAGALLIFIMAVACAGIAFSLYPILIKYSEGLAIAAVGFRVIEAVLMTVTVIIYILLLDLSQEFIKAGAPAQSHFQTLGVLLNAGADWVSNVGMLLAWCIGAMIYYYIFYQTKLIPRWLSGWGLISTALCIMSINFILASVILQNAGGFVFSTALKVLHFSGVGLQVSIGYTNLFIGILLMVLSGVFQYGNNLQEEFDETV